MWKVIIRRVLLMIPQLFILSILVFFFAKLMPGDPFSGLIGPHTDPHEVEALRRAAGLYDPWVGAVSQVVRACHSWKFRNVL